MRHFTVRERVRYRLDTWLARGTGPVIVWMFVIALASVLGVSALVTAAGWAPERNGAPPGYWDVAWMTLMRSLDAGTMANDVGPWQFLVSMLAATVFGLFMLSMLIGLVSNAITTRLEELRKGRSPVVERDHVVVLGWSPHLVPLVRELLMAGSLHPAPCIVILAERDKAEMEDELRQRLGRTGRTRLVCRTGNPGDSDDLALVHPEGARVLVVLPDESSAADVRVIKTLFAVRCQPGVRPGAPRVVTAVKDPAQGEIVRQAAGAGAVVVVTDEMIGRVLAQTARQPGLARVYIELLDYYLGSDIYLLERPELAGKTFGEALGALENACPIGLCDTAGATKLNPPGDTVIEAGDRLFVVTDEIDGVRSTRAPAPPPAESGSYVRPVEPTADRTLVLNWNRRGVHLLRELDRHVVEGASVTVLAQNARVEAELAALGPTLERLKVTWRAGDPRERAALEAAALHFQRSVVVLADSDELPAEDADAGVLVALMQVHAVARATRTRPHVTAEVLDARTRELAESAEADDAVPGDRLVSMLLAQLAENPEFRDVLDELFDAEGCEIRMRPVAEYVHTGAPVAFGTLVEAARRREHIALGYRIAGRSREQAANRGIVLNPDKSAVVTFRADDLVVILGPT